MSYNPYRAPQSQEEEDNTKKRKPPFIDMWGLVFVLTLLYGLPIILGLLALGLSR